MTTLIINIKDSADAKKIADALSLMDSVTEITVKEKMSFEEAVAECNGITAEEFFDKIRKGIKERYDNA